MPNIQLKDPDGGANIEAQGDNYKIISDGAANDSDKTFTVPAGKTWKLDHIRFSFATTAVAGTRQMRIELGNGAAVFWFKNFGATQIESLTRTYYAAADLPDDAAFNSAGQIRMWLLDRVLLPGYTVRIYDVNAFAPTTDDMVEGILVDERDVGTRV